MTDMAPPNRPEGRDAANGPRVCEKCGCEAWTWRDHRGCDMCFGHKHGKDYIARTIATVRQHQGHMNAWPSWANILADEIEDSWAETQALRDAVREIVDAAEGLTRPGSEGVEHVNGVRLTTAIQAGATLIGTTGIFPELGARRG